MTYLSLDRLISIFADLNLLSLRGFPFYSRAISGRSYNYWQSQDAMLNEI